MKHWQCTIYDDERDSFGRPRKIVLTEIGTDKRWAYAPHDMALLNEAGGKVMCSCCSRQLKRKYLNNPNWRYCPKCGAEIMRAL